MNNRSIIVPILVIGALIGGLYFAFAPTESNGAHSIISLTGTLEPGVEAGCVILNVDSGTQYLLTGRSNYPSAGSRVEVTGYFDNTAASYCMQGQATIHVVSISQIEPSGSVSITFVTGSATAMNATVIGGTTEQSTSLIGSPITISGQIFRTVESPGCYPQCLAPSFILTYLYVPPGAGCTDQMGCYPAPRYYRLLNADGSPFLTNDVNGTYVSVTGIVVMPSAWNCSTFYVPKMCMTGDLYVQNVTTT